MSYQDDVDDLLDQVMANTPKKPKAPVPEPRAQEPPKAAPEAPPPPADEPEPEAKAAEPPESDEGVDLASEEEPRSTAPEEPPAAREEPSPRARRAPAKKAPEKAAAPDDGKPDKRGRAVAMDRDLLDLMKLARPALGVKVARLMLDAARAHMHHAAELPDTPVKAVVLDFFGDVEESEARHPITTTPYMTEETVARLDEASAAAGLDRSSFVRRVLRAYLTVDVAFVPTEMLGMLHSPAELEHIAWELQDIDRPARALPSPIGRVWTVYRVPEGHPLRGPLDAARESMPGCFSATQALLTVLPPI